MHIELISPLFIIALQLPSAHAIEREYRMIKALETQGLPVPRALHLCEDPAIIGTPFYVMEYVNGRIFKDPSLPELQQQERAEIYNAMNDVCFAIAV